MRWIRLFTLCLSSAATCSMAGQPDIHVFCPAISFDSHNDRGSNGPGGPSEVVLMVVAKVALDAPSNPDRPATPADDRKEHLRLEKEGADLLIERVLFGSSPGARIHVQTGIGGRFPKDAAQVPYVYGLTCGRGDSPAYSLNSYYSYDRTFPVDQLAAIQALARARLDYLVLGAASVVIAQPSTDQPAKGLQPITIERSLHGNHVPNDSILIERERNPIPLSGGGPWIYFLQQPHKDVTGRLAYPVDTKWAMSETAVVQESLSRRERYPIRETTDEYGRTVRRQEILMTGSRGDAIALFNHPSQTLEILAARRLIHEGQSAVPDVVATIEKQLWQKSLPVRSQFGCQKNLIQLLALLENHRTDGEVASLIGDVLMRAEAGTEFPATDAVASTPNRRYAKQLDEGTNHSLAWLLQTLPEADAARLFGSRLLKLRDLAAYGWKDEAQFVIDDRHLEDRLELAQVEPRFREIRPAHWRVGLDAKGRGFDRIAFSPDGKWFASVGDNGKIWRTADWSLAAKFPTQASVNDLVFSPDGRSLYVAGGAAIGVLDKWDWQSGKVEARYPGIDTAFDAISLTRDGQRLIVSQAGLTGSLTQVFDTKTGQALQEFKDEDWRRLALAPNGERFIGMRDGTSWIGDLRRLQPEKLPFTSLGAIWVDDDVYWSLEENLKAAPIQPSPTDGNPFDSSPSRRPSVLRLRREGTHAVTIERPVSFTAAGLHLSAAGKTLLVHDDQHYQLFSGPEWKPEGNWKVAKPAGENSLRSYRKKQVALSPDGRTVAVAEEYSFPKLYEAASGKRLPLGAGHSAEIVSLSFADGGSTVQTLDDEGTLLTWNVKSGELQGREQVMPPAEAEDRQDPKEISLKDEHGELWSFEGKGFHRPYGFIAESYEVRVGGKRTEEDNGRTPGVLRGEIEPGNGEIGLVPGGEFLHLGTHIRNRVDLRLVSSTNPACDRIEKIFFSANGARYAMLTTDDEYEHAPFGLGEVRRTASQRIRIHDTRTVRTLFCITPNVEILFLAYSPDGLRVAAVTKRQEMQVWSLEEDFR